MELKAIRAQADRCISKRLPHATHHFGSAADHSCFHYLASFLWCLLLIPLWPLEDAQRFPPLVDSVLHVFEKMVKNTLERKAYLGALPGLACQSAQCLPKVMSLLAVLHVLMFCCKCMSSFFSPPHTHSLCLICMRFLCVYVTPSLVGGPSWTLCLMQTLLYSCAFLVTIMHFLSCSPSCVYTVLNNCIFSHACTSLCNPCSCAWAVMCMHTCPFMHSLTCVLVCSSMHGTLFLTCTLLCPPLHVHFLFLLLSCFPPIFH